MSPQHLNIECTFTERDRSLVEHANVFRPVRFRRGLAISGRRRAILVDLGREFGLTSRRRPHSQAVHAWKIHEESCVRQSRELLNGSCNRCLARRRGGNTRDGKAREMEGKWAQHRARTGIRKSRFPDDPRGYRRQSSYAFRVFDYDNCEVVDDRSRHRNKEMI